MVKCLWSISLGIGVFTLMVSADACRDLYSDTWVATDALGRSLPGYDEVGPPRENRTVGIFYWTWLAQHARKDRTVYDNTEIIAANPIAPVFGQGPHFWGKPEL